MHTYAGSGEACANAQEARQIERGMTLAGFAVGDRRDAMILEGPKTHWDHVHQCGGCGHAVRIDHIDLKIITGGVITCPQCERSGPINVKIMDERLIPACRPPSHRNG